MAQMALRERWYRMTPEERQRALERSRPQTSPTRPAQRG
jgi:hypothetical protein